jgi:hypothetical protein
MTSVCDQPRIVLIHALMDSIAPAHAAFAAEWPDALIRDLVYTALLDDTLDETSQAGETEKAIALLLQVALLGAPRAKSTDGVLFTCSAFGSAIDRLRAEFEVPMIHPTEAAIEAALVCGESIVAVVSTAAAVNGIINDFARYAERYRPGARLDVQVAAGALEALRRHDQATHDKAMLRQMARVQGADVILLPQFSTAHLAAAARDTTSKRIVTAPQAAVVGLRNLITSDNITYDFCSHPKLH